MREMNMHLRILASIGLAAALGVGTASTVLAGPSKEPNCGICTCADGAVLCLDTTMGGEVVEEQGPCGPACSNIGSSFESLVIIETQCEDLPVCDHAEAPASSPMWLASAALAMFLLGGAAARRLRSRAKS